jgi:NAD(P)-dependent dehydrogenase (short-subunit alcohol dehydrogenase family)
MIGIDLSGKVALICGAGAGGIGSSVTEVLGKAGATIAALDRDEALTAEIASTMAAAGVPGSTFVANLMDKAQAAKVVERVLDKMGRIDILVNVAGGSKAHQWIPLERTSDAIWAEVFALNLDYTMRVSADVARHLIENKRGGAIVNFASISAHNGAPFHGPYGAAKRGIMAITETMAVEWARYGIRANAIAPGGTRTPRVIAFGGSGTSETFSQNDGRRSVESMEVANGVLFLVSDLASGISGQTLTIDAGLSCANPAGGLFHFAAMVSEPA